MSEALAAGLNRRASSAFSAGLSAATSSKRARAARRSVARWRAAGRTDGELDLRLGRTGRRKRFVVRTTRTHLSYALTSGFIEEARAAGQNWLLLAPYVPGKIGQHLAESKLSYPNVVETALAKALCSPQKGSVGTSWVRSPPSSKPRDLTDLPDRMLSEPCAIDEPEQGYLAIGRSP